MSLPEVQREGTALQGGTLLWLNLQLPKPALGSLLQCSPWLCKSAWWAQQGSKCQNQRIFTPTCIFSVEKAYPVLLSQPFQAAHHPCPSGEVTLSNLAPSTNFYPANEKQPNSIQPIPSSSCFQQKSPKNRRGAVRPSPGCWEQMGTRRPPAVPSPPCCPQPGRAAPWSWQGLGSSFSWRMDARAPPGLVLRAQQLLFHSCHVILPWVYFKRCI